MDQALQSQELQSKYWPWISRRLWWPLSLCQFLTCTFTVQVVPPTVTLTVKVGMSICTLDLTTFINQNVLDLHTMPELVFPWAYVIFLILKVLLSLCSSSRSGGAACCVGDMVRENFWVGQGEQCWAGPVSQFSATHSPRGTHLPWPALSVSSLPPSAKQQAGQELSPGFLACLGSPSSVPFSLPVSPWLL